jgi:type IV pilus assembly protein PilN
MRVDINLASKPYEDAQLFWRQWGAALAAAGVVTLALVGYSSWQLYTAHRDNRAINTLRQSIAELDQKTAEIQAVLNRPENRMLRARSAYLNSLFREKAFSWTRVFEDLEQMMPPQLHVVSIHPEMTPENQLQIKLTVAGESRERAVELVRRMEDSQRFRETRIRGENSRTSQTPGDQVEFDISALYTSEIKPAGTRAP